MHTKNLSECQPRDTCGFDFERLKQALATTVAKKKLKIVGPQVPTQFRVDDHVHEAVFTVHVGNVYGCSDKRG
jgi:hypothetical protein